MGFEGKLFLIVIQGILSGATGVFILSNCSQVGHLLRNDKKISSGKASL
jgi:hypothetical protein